MKKKLLYILFLLIITPLCFEGALRVMGYSPYRNLSYSITSKPANCLVASDNLGFALETGTFEVTINEKHSYTATHKNGERITSLKPTNDSLPSIFMMGCSYTYGMGVNDDENMAYLLQKKLSRYRVRNFGVPGFGTVQSYLQLEQSIAAGIIPEVVVINYCDFHDERNILSPSYRQHLTIGFAGSSEEAKSEMRKAKFPYFNEGEIIYEKGNELYKNWIGRETFALINYLQSNADKSANSQLNPSEATLAIFQKIKSLCELHETKLIVTSLIRTKAATKFLHQLDDLGLQTLDISLDLSLKKYTNRPYDSHPNALAHKYYSQEIITAITQFK